MFTILDMKYHIMNNYLYRNNYLTLIPVYKNKDMKMKMQIITMTNMQIRFNSDDDFPLRKTLKMYNLVILTTILGKRL